MAAEHIETPVTQIESLSEYYLALKKRPDLKDPKLVELTFRQALAGVPILRELNPSHLLASAQDTVRAYIAAHPDYLESLQASTMIQEARDAIDRGIPFTAIDAVVVVLKARDVTDLPFYRRTNNLVTMLPAIIKNWYQRRTALELCVGKEVQRSESELAAANFSLRTTQQELEKMKQERGEAKEDESVVGSIGGQSMAMSRAGVLQQSKLDVDSKKMGQKNASRKYKPAFYLSGIKQKIASVLPRDEARIYAQSIEADYELLIPYISEQGVVTLPTDDNAKRVMARLHALETSLDYLVKQEALKLGDTINRQTDKKSFEKTITHHVLNLYKSQGNILFQADPTRVDFYKGLWDTRYQAAAEPSVPQEADPVVTQAGLRHLTAAAGLSDSDLVSRTFKLSTLTAERDAISSAMQRLQPGSSHRAQLNESLQSIKIQIERLEGAAALPPVPQEASGAHAAVALANPGTVQVSLFGGAAGATPSAADNSDRALSKGEDKQVLPDDAAVPVKSS
jgi:hypothetical protein